MYHTTTSMKFYCLFFPGADQLDNIHFDVLHSRKPRFVQRCASNGAPLWDGTDVLTYIFFFPPENLISKWHLSVLQRCTLRTVTPTRKTSVWVTQLNKRTAILFRTTAFPFTLSQNNTYLQMTFHVSHSSEYKDGFLLSVWRHVYQSTNHG
jgi:hypothetical protein